MPSQPEADEVPIPALLRAARGSYGHAVRSRLLAAGFEDLPRNGPYVLGGIVNQRGSAADLVRELGVSKQAASQLIDALVLRGYLERQTNPEDRRRVTIDATDRGRRRRPRRRRGDRRRAGRARLTGRARRPARRPDRTVRHQGATRRRGRGGNRDPRRPLTATSPRTLPARPRAATECVRTSAPRRSLRTRTSSPESASSER
jgi:hypothetical protein